MKKNVLSGLLILGLYGFSLFYRGGELAMTPFREAQTAITAQAMERGESPFFAYHVPVLGQPWAVPMEFPLYQALVSLLNTGGAQQMVWVGRGLSLLFGAMSLWVLGQLLKLSPLTNSQRNWILLGVAAAPIYVGYSATFLIETCALFFCLLALWLGLRMLLGSPSVLWGLLSVTAGVLGALVKPTTWAPFAGVYLLGAGAIFWSRTRTGNWKSLLPQCIWVLLGLAIPLGIALQWVHFGDAVKLQNPLAASLVSENLSRWNYGSWEQKLSPKLWAIILGKHGLLLWGPVFPAFLFILAAGLWKALKEKSFLWGCWLLIPLAGYAAGPVIFTNLYYRHDYYLVANGVFAWCAVGLATAYVAGPYRIRTRNILYTVFALSIGCAALGYTALRRSFREPSEEVLVERLSEIDQEGAVVFLGLSWSSHMPYWLERRALMTEFSETSSERFRSIVEANQGLPIAAVVSGSPQQEAGAKAFMQAMGLEFSHQTEVWPGIRVWSEEPLQTMTEGTGWLESITRKVPPDIAPQGNLLYVHHWLRPASDGKGPLQIIFRRGGSLFVLDVSEPGFFRVKNYFQHGEPEG